MTQLDTKITESKRQKDLIIARARTAKTSVKVNDMLSNVNTGTSSMAAFDRMKEKVEVLESQAEIAGQLAASSTGSDLDIRFKQLEGNTALDSELDMLKKLLPSGSDKANNSKNVLPAELQKELDSEYEAMKKELKR